MDKDLGTNNISVSEDTGSGAVVSNNSVCSNILMTAAVVFAVSGSGVRAINPSLSTSSVEVKTNHILKAPKSYKSRYELIGQSDWFKKSYENRSIGEILSTD